jgi:hypothetical protein
MPCRSNVLIVWRHDIAAMFRLFLSWRIIGYV